MIFMTNVRKGMSNVNIFDSFKPKSTADSELATTRILQKVSYNGIVLSKKAEDYPRWFEYDFGIKNPYKKLCELRDKGYLKNSSSETALKKWKLPEIKQALEKQGLSTKGKKEELIQRLVSDGSVSRIKLPEVLELTEKGWEFLSANGILLEKNVETIQQLLEKLTHLTEPNQFGQMRNVYLSIAQQYEKDGLNLQALQNYIFVAYFDLCSDCRLGKPVCYGTAYGIVKTIKSLEKYFTDSMIENCYRLYVPAGFKKPEKSNFRKEIKKILEE